MNCEHVLIVIREPNFGAGFISSVFDFEAQWNFMPYWTVRKCSLCGEVFERRENYPMRKTLNEVADHIERNDVL